MLCAQRFIFAVLRAENKALWELKFYSGSKTACGSRPGPATLTPVVEFIMILSRKSQGVVPSPTVNPGMVHFLEVQTPTPLLQISVTEKIKNKNS